VAQGSTQLTTRVVDDCEVLTKSWLIISEPAHFNMALRSQSCIRPFQLLLVTALFLMMASSTVWNGQGNYTSLSDAFVELTDLTLQPDSHRNPLKEGQNFTHCCLLVVNASLEVVNGFVVKKIHLHISLQPSMTPLLLQEQVNSLLVRFGMVVPPVFLLSKCLILG
jgi:hypothetical protein